MKIFISGASGMVGKNLVAGLSADNHKILSPDRGQLNLLNYSDTFNYISKERPDLIINSAGRVGGIHANIANPVGFLVDNIDINRNLIMAAKNAGIKKMINLGSSCMYPRDAKNPLTEDLVLKGELEPTNEGYAIAKIFAQRLCDYISREDSSFQYKTLLPCNLYGPHDKFDSKHSHLIPAIIVKVNAAIANHETEIEIWGTGEARREFMFVGDLVDCIRKAVVDFDTLPMLMNVGLGYDFTVNEYYQAVTEVMGFKGRFIHNLDKPVGMKQKLVDTSKAKQWGWQSQTALKDGILNTVNYYKNLKAV